MRNMSWIQTMLFPLLFLFVSIWAILLAGGIGNFPAISSTSLSRMSRDGQGMIAEVAVRFPSQQAPIDLSIPRDSFNLPVLLKEALLARIQTPAPPVQQPVDAVQPDAPAVPFPVLRIQGLFWGSGRPQAIINRRIISEGETLSVSGAEEGVKVLEITADGVKVSFQGKEFFLKNLLGVSGSNRVTGEEV